MKRLLTLLICLVPCALPTYAPCAEVATDISQKAKPATIKILVAKNAKAIMLEAKGRYHVYNPENQYLVSSGTFGKCDLLVGSDKGIKWGDNIPYFQSLRIVPGDSQATLLVNGIQYRGCVEVYLINGKIHVINETDIDHYLKSVLTSQVSSEMGKEVMEALAIVARTKAFYEVARNGKSHWHLSAAEAGYEGYGVTFQNLAVDKAVEATRNMILTLNGSPFAAEWTKDSGGKTAKFTNIFRREALAAQGVDAPLAAQDRTKHSWRFTLAKADLAKAAHLKDLSHVDLFLDKESGKVYGLKLTSSEGAKTMSFFRLQELLGEHRLRSNDFTVDLKGSAMTFSGYGEGHGVGLCLYSASQMAKQGMSVDRILTTFFPGAKLQNLSGVKK